MQVCPTSGLILPTQFIDAKQSLKRSINEWVERAVNDVTIKENYFLTLHARFDRCDPTTFTMDAPKVTLKLPPFMSNSFVYWVSPKRGICELLWMVAARKRGEKLKVEFNTQGVAYLQAKGAMPS